MTDRLPADSDSIGSGSMWTTFVTERGAVMVRSIPGGHWTPLVRGSGDAPPNVTVWVGSEAGEEPVAVEIDLPERLGEGEHQLLDFLASIGIEHHDLPSLTIFPAKPGKDRIPTGPFIWWGPQSD